MLREQSRKVEREKQLAKDEAEVGGRIPTPPCLYLLGVASRAMHCSVANAT
jgi:hypothetical protein